MSDVIEIRDLSGPELSVYNCRSEVQLLRYNEPEPGIFIAESPKVIMRALDAGYEPVSLLAERRLLGKALREILRRCGDAPVYTAGLDTLTQITGFRLTQGVLCAMRRRELPSVEEVCAGARRIAVLEDVTNQTNIGAVFRSAAALGFDAVLLTGDCCDPLYRRSIRVSMGTVFQIPWTYLDNGEWRECADRETGMKELPDRKELPGRNRETAAKRRPGNAPDRTEDGTPGQSDYVSRLQNMGFAAAAMALREDSVRIDDPRLLAEEKIAVILGNEGSGLRDSTIRACDYTVRIPMAHGVDSLNVAAAGAVAFWELGREQRRTGEDFTF